MFLEIRDCMFCSCAYPSKRTIREWGEKCYIRVGLITSLRFKKIIMNTAATNIFGRKHPFYMGGKRRSLIGGAPVPESPGSDRWFMWEYSQQSLECLHYPSSSTVIWLYPYFFFFYDHKCTK